MVDVHGSPGDAPQMPQASSSGSAPVPFAGARWPEPPVYGAVMGPLAPADGYVLHGVTGLGTAQAAGAHDITAADLGVSGVADAPYYPGPLSPIYTGGDNDAGGRSPVASTVAEAVANATGRWQELASDTHQQGSQIGDGMTLPVSALDPGVGSLGSGETDPSGQFYDPPRGGAPEAFVNTGNLPA